jgi:hypothetical protein
MTIPENYRQVADRWDQYKQTQVRIWYGKGKNDPRGTFFIEVNDKVAGPYNKSELEALMDSLKMDLDFKNPAMGAM